MSSCRGQWACSKTYTCSYGYKSHMRLFWRFTISIITYCVTLKAVTFCFICDAHLVFVATPETNRLLIKSKVLSTAPQGLASRACVVNEITYFPLGVFGVRCQSRILNMKKSTKLLPSSDTACPNGMYCVVPINVVSVWVCEMKPDIWCKK